MLNNNYRGFTLIEIILAIFLISSFLGLSGLYMGQVDRMESIYYRSSDIAYIYNNLIDKIDSAMYSGSNSKDPLKDFIFSGESEYREELIHNNRIYEIKIIKKPEDSYLRILKLQVRLRGEETFDEGYEIYIENRKGS